jgi:hypothetical protein
MSGIPNFNLYCEQFHRGEKYFSGVEKQNPRNMEGSKKKAFFKAGDIKI